MNDQPLDNAELEFLEETLMKYGDDFSILNASELDGYFTALVSGPEMIDPSVWFPAIWEGREIDWEDPEEFKRFFGLAIRHMNSIATTLMESPEQFVAMFEQHEMGDELIDAPEEWCFGYMRGVGLSAWQLPPAETALLETISLHGLEENFAALDELSKAQFIQSTTLIDPAVRALHAYWLSKRMHLAPSASAGAKVGRNDPCTCGSGKKFKQCCLH